MSRIDKCLANKIRWYRWTLGVSVFFVASISFAKIPVEPVEVKGEDDSLADYIYNHIDAPTTTLSHSPVIIKKELPGLDCIKSEFVSVSKTNSSFKCSIKEEIIESKLSQDDSKEFYESVTTPKYESRTINSTTTVKDLGPIVAIRSARPHPIFDVVYKKDCANIDGVTAAESCYNMWSKTVYQNNPSSYVYTSTVDDVEDQLVQLVRGNTQLSDFNRDSFVSVLDYADQAYVGVLMGFNDSEIPTITLTYLLLENGEFGMPLELNHINIRADKGVSDAYLNRVSLGIEKLKSDLLLLLSIK